MTICTSLKWVHVGCPECWRMSWRETGWDSLATIWQWLRHLKPYLRRGSSLLMKHGFITTIQKVNNSQWSGNIRRVGGGGAAGHVHLPGPRGDRSSLVEKHAKNKWRILLLFSKNFLSVPAFGRVHPPPGGDLLRHWTCWVTNSKEIQGLSFGRQGHVHCLLGLWWANSCGLLATQTDYQRCVLC